MIEFENVSYIYPDGNTGVDSVSFKVADGETIGIVGANGAGKSTLLMLLVGIMVPQKGTIRVGDLILSRKNISDIRRRVGFVFQDPEDQLFMSRVYDDVAFGLRNMKVPEEHVSQRVMDTLEQTGIPHLKDRTTFRLSGGEKRLVALASILSMSPETLVLDEPTSFLDPGSRRRFINLLSTLDHTKIIASHDLDMVMDLCSNVILLSQGRIAASGSTSEILGDEALLNKYGLELPLSMQRKY